MAKKKNHNRIEARTRERVRERERNGISFDNANGEENRFFASWLNCQYG